MGVIIMYPLLFLLSSILVDQVMMMDHGSSWCKQCKQVEGDGPLSGHYYLQSDHDPKGDDLYCFVPGQEVVNPCDDQGSGMSDMTTMEMKPVTFLPPVTGSAPPPAPSDSVCGLRRSGGECIKDGRIVNGQEAGCNEWPWQVGIVRREGSSVSTGP